jgi:hypothetical protein
MNKLEITDHNYKRIFRLSWTIILLLSLSVIGLAQTPSENSVKKQNSQTSSLKQCSENPDNSYNRKQTLEKFADLLNELIPTYKKINGRGFLIENDRSVGFFVQDLTDPSNSGISLKNCINFIEGHIYHFAPIKRRLSFSHIAVLENGELRIFRSINCKDKGDSLDDVLNYLNKKLADCDDKEEILNRVKDYRKYGIYTTVDALYLECEEVDQTSN